jgi:hypothetical protein
MPTSCTLLTAQNLQKLIKDRRAEGLEGRNDTLSEMIRGTSGGEQMTDEEIQDQVCTSILKKSNCHAQTRQLCNCLASRSYLIESALELLFTMLQSCRSCVMRLGCCAPLLCLKCYCCFY